MHKRAILRWCYWYFHGQKIVNKFQMMKTALEDFHMKFNEELSEDLKLKLTILIERCNNQATIKPLNSFDLNLHSAISTLGIVFTYLVILIQFKHGAASEEPQSFKNNNTMI